MALLTPTTLEEVIPLQAPPRLEPLTKTLPFRSSVPVLAIEAVETFVVAVPVGVTVPQTQRPTVLHRRRALRPVVLPPLPTAQVARAPTEETLPRPTAGAVRVPNMGAPTATATVAALEAPTPAVEDAQVPVGPRAVGQAVTLDAGPTGPSPSIALLPVLVPSAIQEVQASRLVHFCVSSDPRGERRAAQIPP